uniref:Uncharacterized protein n=1 Tax=Nelumbo nucifera TaxID=4432 RepID=A0A822ZLR2_NELNU|nr:TPA_asm: hypothetical protein HUJ06_002146 [Nelumbo nucifera]
MASRLWASRAASYLRVSVRHRGFASGKLNSYFAFPFRLPRFASCMLTFGKIKWRCKEQRGKGHACIFRSPL